MAKKRPHYNLYENLDFPDYVHRPYPKALRTPEEVRKDLGLPEGHQTIVKDEDEHRAQMAEWGTPLEPKKVEAPLPSGKPGAPAKPAAAPAA